MRKLFGMVTTRHSSEYTVAALESFFRRTPLEDDDQFLLIDNDGNWNPEMVPAEARGKLEIVVNPQRLTVSGNANQVIRRADARDADAYFMNNDIIFTKGWLEPVAAQTDAV